jgi:putative FmdB family regulatory protein
MGAGSVMLRLFSLELQSRKESTMPTYSYKCQACRKSFSLQMTIAKHDKARTKCPKCGSRKIQQSFGSFGAITSKKS